MSIKHSETPLNIMNGVWPFIDETISPAPSVETTREEILKQITSARSLVSPSLCMMSQTVEHFADHAITNERDCSFAE
jgi:hypothetical protein